MAEIALWRSQIKIDDLSMKAEKGGVSFVSLCRTAALRCTVSLRVTLACYYYFYSLLNLLFIIYHVAIKLFNNIIGLPAPF